MGNVSQQNEEALQNQILLLGIKNQGKTKFLYEFLLKGTFKGHINQTEGYNYEVMQVNQDSFGVWDLAGCSDFRALWKNFYSKIPFSAFFIIVRISDNEKETSKNLAKTRHLIKEVIGIEYFDKKLLVLIINIPDNLIFGNIKNTYIKESDKQLRRREASIEIKQVLQWKEIDHQPKWDYALDFRDSAGVDNFWSDFQQIYNKFKK